MFPALTSVRRSRWTTIRDGARLSLAGHEHQHWGGRLLGIEDDREHRLSFVLADGPATVSVPLDAVAYVYRVKGS
jgi:hypothetical protein